MKEFLLAFVPLFVALDPPGLLPIFLGLTQRLEPKRRRRIVLESAATALALGVGFVFLGRWVFGVLSIRMYDFTVAGGILLFLIATIDILTGIRIRPGQSKELSGPVPLGTPLMAGPATLTTLLMLVDLYGLTPTLLAFGANMVLATASLLAAGQITRVLGQAGTRVLSKVAALILAAIAVMMIRRGIEQMIAGFAAAATTPAT